MPTAWLESLSTPLVRKIKKKKSTLSALLSRTTPQVPSTLSSRDCSSDTYLMQPHAAIQLRKPSPGYFWSRGTPFFCVPAIPAQGIKAYKAAQDSWKGHLLFSMCKQMLFFRKMHNSLPACMLLDLSSLSFFFFLPSFLLLYVLMWAKK